MFYVVFLVAWETVFTAYKHTKHVVFFFLNLAIQESQRKSVSGSGSLQVVAV